MPTLSTSRDKVIEPIVLEPSVCDTTVEEVEVEESTWCGSDQDSDEQSEEELPSPRKLLAPRLKPLRQPLFTQPQQRNHLPDSFKDLAIFDSESDSSRSKKDKGSDQHTVLPSRPGSSSDKENSAAILRFSPPRLHSPSKEATTRPVTPPQSPSKSRLQSPSKTRNRIPTPPLCQSLDAFWNAETVNDWNEQYSPKKTLKSPKKLLFHRGQSPESPISSPRKLKSPAKNTKAESLAKKSFASRKHDVASRFLAELDTEITQSRINTLSSSTGGVHLVWSKSLNTTAGRANWRKETTKTHDPSTNTTKITYVHHASIELAEKIIDTEDRLFNVLAHEFCHLANFMISGVKDQPHGKSFKEWGRKCNASFGDRGVTVTTKHSYRIEYKFLWQCSNEDCGAEFGRHSKSIDPNKKVCGHCKGRLVQVRPAPRKENGGGGYAVYVKANFAEVKKSLPNASQKEIMEAVARKYRSEKEKGVGIPGSKTTSKDLEKVTEALEVIAIDDD
jgi:predicted SprT family Zn-dependent metalloprotease